MLVYSRIFPKEGIRNECRSKKEETRTCLQWEHWNASVSACCSAAPRELKILVSFILRSATFRSSDTMSSLVLVWIHSPGISPLTTLSVRLGLFLSFKLTKCERPCISH